MKETDYQRLIIDYLTVLEKQNKLWFQRTNNTAIYDPVGKKFRSLSKGQKKGFPDIIVFMNGKTIVATDIPGVNEIVNDKNGILVPVKDSERLAEAIKFLASSTCVI